MPAPIALFTYNRADHLKRTVEALSRNDLASESDLIIYSDGPQSPSEPKVALVRNYIRGIDGFKSVRIIERAENFGLARSIIQGVTEIVNQYGRIIVLEDDLVTSPYFLRFMNDALDLYERDPEIISVHGFMYPLNASLPETFFLRYVSSWGWATWKRGWDYFNSDAASLLQGIRSKHLTKDFNIDNSFDYTYMLERQAKTSRSQSWAIRWYASAFLSAKLSLYPRQSLIENIGFDELGTHTRGQNIYSSTLPDAPVKVTPQAHLENPTAREALKNFYLSTRPNFISKVAGKLSRLFGN